MRRSVLLILLALIVLAGALSGIGTRWILERRQEAPPPPEEKPWGHVFMVKVEGVVCAVNTRGGIDCKW